MAEPIIMVAARSRPPRPSPGGAIGSEIVVGGSAGAATTGAARVDAVEARCAGGARDGVVAAVGPAGGSVVSVPPADESPPAPGDEKSPPEE
jgi:hypothetical protein